VLPLVAIGVAGAALRVAYVLALGRHVDLGLSDASFYSVAADLLAEGEGYVDIWRSFEFGEGELLATAHHPPGWPAFLAPFSAVGLDGELAHRLVGAVLGGAVVVLVGLVARRAAGARAGLVAAGLAAVHPTLIAADGSLMAETLAGALVLVALLLGLRVARRPTPPVALALGGAVGLGALVRGEALALLALVALPVAVAVARRSRPGGFDLGRGTAVLALSLVGALAVVGPWTLRNARVLGEPIPISTNESTVLAGANCPPAYEGPGLGGWDLSCVQPTAEGEVADSDRWREEGLDHLRANLDRVPVVVPVRLLRTYGVWDPLGTDAEGRHDGTQRAGNLAWLAILLPAGVAGAVVLARRGERLLLVVLLAPVASATFVTVVGFGMIRFRHPIELSALVLAGVAADAARRRRRSPVAPAPPAVVGS